MLRGLEWAILVGLPYEILRFAKAPGVRTRDDVIEWNGPCPFLLQIIELKHTVRGNPIVILELHSAFRSMVPTAMVG